MFLLGQIAIGDWLTALIAVASLALPLESEQSTAHGCHGRGWAHRISLLQPTWVVVK